MHSAMAARGPLTDPAIVCRFVIVLSGTGCHAGLIVVLLWSRRCGVQGAMAARGLLANPAMFAGL